MDININRQGEAPLYLQIKNAIRRAIENGSLPPGYRLPPTRNLARQLAVNRNTVASAYDELLADGLIDSHVGRGTFVGESPASNGSAAAAAVEAKKMVWEGLFARGFDGPAVSNLRDLFQVITTEGFISFAGSYPADVALPANEFRRCLNYVLRRQGRALLKYGHSSGYAPFLEYLCRRMQKEGIDARAENVLVTNGSQQGLHLVAQLLLDPGDTVIVENPTYTGAISVFASLQAKLVGLPVDGQGMDVGHLEAAIARAQPKLIYCTPNFHNPTAATLSMPRRRQLLALSRRYRVPILEDNYGGELRLEGEPLLSLKAMDDGDQVLYLSSFSKNLLPGIRMGWLAGPADVMGRLIAVKQLEDVATSPLLQAATLEFCRRRYYKAHLEKTRQLYRRRRDQMLNALERYFPKGAVWSRPAGGLFLWVTLPEAVNTDDVFLQARKQGILFSRGSLFFIDGRGRHSMRLSYSTPSEAEIERGMRVLGRIVHSFLQKSKTKVYFTARESVPLV